jgi:hypothetical protein
MSVFKKPDDDPPIHASQTYRRNSAHFEMQTLKSIEPFNPNAAAQSTRKTSAPSAVAKSHIKKYLNVSALSKFFQ